METHEQAVKRGKKSRKEGKDFEARVRSDLTEKGWTVCRFDNDVKENKLFQAKTNWRRTPFGMFPMNLSPGFPDFIISKHCLLEEDSIKPIVEIKRNSKLGLLNEVKELDLVFCNIAVECKINGTLDKLEKQKCQWLLDNNIFSKILIASKHKIKNRIHIKYKEWKSK